MSDILIRKDNGVLELQFNRPEKKNALNESMYEKLEQALVNARIDDDVAVVLISGQKSCFTAGNDLADFLNHPPNNEDAPVFRFLKTVADYPKPIVAAVNGIAVGIGTTLLLHCDLVYCGESTLFQLPFVRLGLVPEFGASYLLPLRVGHAKASEWLLTGKTFDAKEAAAAGLVNEVYKDEILFGAARHQAQVLAGMPKYSTQITKRLLKQTYMAKTLQSMEEESEYFRVRLESDEFKSAAAAFLSKKSP